MLDPKDNPEDHRLGSTTRATLKNADDHQEEKYNELVSKLSELTNKKIEITNTIKTKTNNRDLLRKAKYAATGKDGEKEGASSQGMSFTVVHMAIAFGVSFVIGLYFGSG